MIAIALMLAATAPAPGPTVERYQLIIPVPGNPSGQIMWEYASAELCEKEREAMGHRGEGEMVFVVQTAFRGRAPNPDQPSRVATNVAQRKSAFCRPIKLSAKLYERR